MKLRLAVIYGSVSCEHDVSIISGLQAAQNANPEEYEIIYVYIDHGGEWYTGANLGNVAFYRNFDPRMVMRVIPMGADGKLRLMQHPDDKLLPIGRLRVVAEADVCLTVLHGMNGEDGSLQGMLELWNVPYTSSGILGSAVGMDKIVMKQVFRACGLACLDDVVVSRSQWREDRAGVVARVEAALSYPVYVKPANLGSSIGISRADDRNGLEDAIDVAVSYDRRVLVEKGVENLMEVNCAVLGYGDEATASMTEMPVSWQQFLSFDDKYLRGGKGGKSGSKRSGEGMSSLNRQMPAPLQDDMIRRVEEMAVAAFRALDCKGVCRVDFLIDKTADTIYVGEINTIPGSLAFYLWEPKGLPFSALIDKMVEYALRANSDRRENTFSYQSAILNRVGGGAKGAKG